MKYESDSRYYARMLEGLDSFRRGDIQIPDLISNLDALVECLEQRDIEWVSEFRKHWGILEEVYAVSLDRNKTFDSQDFRLINESLQNINELIRKRLANPR